MNDMAPWSIVTATSEGASTMLLGGIVGEVAAGATAGQRRAFFRAVGARIAAAHPVDDAPDIAALADAINRFWYNQDCGQVRFEIVEDGLLIIHSGFGRRLSPILSDMTEQVLRPILEGAYDAWLHALGSGANLTTRTLWWNDTEARLKHGR